MAINTSALNSTLQTKVDALVAATDTKEVLLLSKALDAAAGSIAVSDVLGEGVVQVNNVSTEGAAQVSNVQAAGATQVTNIQTVGSTQVASVQGVLGNYTPSASLASVATSGNYNDLSNKFDPNTLHSVAQSGDFNSLSNKPAGSAVVQVKTLNKSSVWSTTSINPVNISGLSLSITPMYANSTILVWVNLATSNDNQSGEWGGFEVTVTRNGSRIALGDYNAGQGQASVGGLRGRNHHGTHTSAVVWKDSPTTTSATTYQVQGARADYGGGSAWLNRAGGHNEYSSSGVSSITLMEVRP